MIYISIGSNLVDRINNLRTAVHLLTKKYLRNVRLSMIIETEAILPDDAPSGWDKPFLNMVIGGDTDLSPKELLAFIKSIESEMGRPSNYQRWEPRIIDLDVLLWDEYQINSSDLIIPHPELNNRPFFQHLLALMGVQTWNKTFITKSFNKALTLYPPFVGVVNITSDSFSDGGLFNQPDKAIEQIHKLTNDGASIIELGAQSTRPQAIIHTAEEEYNKLKPVLDGISELLSKNIIKISIDSFWSSTIRKILNNYHISWINDVEGSLDDKTLKIINEAGCKLCFMHSLGILPSYQITLPLEQDPIKILIEWGKKSIDRFFRIGFAKEDLIFDSGIGFGKNMYQNIEILRRVEEFKSLDIQLMIGHSRKSYIQAFSNNEAKDRDIETIAISCAIKDKVDFLRVHNVQDHMRFFASYHNFQ